MALKHHVGSFKFYINSYPRGGDTLIVSYIRRLSSFFWVQILNFNIFGGFLKNKYFFGYEDFVDIFLGHHKI